MKSFLTIIILLIVVSISDIQAQEVWDLEKCVNYAIQHNLNLKTPQIQIDQNNINLKERQGIRLPDLNMRVNGGLNLGRSIDPTSNSFVTATSSFNSYTLSSNMTIYNFGRLTNQIRQSKYDIEASHYSLEQAKQDMSLNVVSAYIDILFANDNLNNAKTHQSTSEAQLNQLLKLIEVGNRPTNARLELDAQIARDQQSIIQFENALSLGELRLKQIMQLDPSIDIQLVRPEIEAPPIEVLDLDITNIYMETLENQNILRSFEYQLKSAQLNQDIAKSQLYPAIGLSAQMGTNFSSQAKDFDLLPDQSVNSVLIDGSPAEITSNIVRREVIGTTPYATQIDNNLGAGISIGLNIPIFNAYSNKADIERAKLNYINIENNLEIEKQNIRSQIEKSVTDVRSAQRQMIASEKTVQAFEAAYVNTQKRFDLGAANSFELTSAKNSLENARVDFIRTKYDYIFKIKILDYYRGRPLILQSH